MPEPAITPVPETHRLETLDVLRGFALLGILAMNIRAMGAPFSAYMYPYALFDYEGASRVAYRFTSIVFDLKMMGLFSMLFGAGVLLYAAKPTATGRPPRALWFRRMAWLLVIGLVHAYFVWDGDILVPYALCGLLFLWWVRRLPAWALLLGAIGFLAIGAMMSIGHGLSWEYMPEEDRLREARMWMPTREQALEQLAPLRAGYADLVAHRAPFVLSAQTFVFLVFFVWRCGGMMLLGMALYKLGFLDGRWSAVTYAVVAAICVPVGLIAAWQGVDALEQVRYAMPDRTRADNWNYFGSVSASVGYASAIILAIKLDALRVARRALAAVGRMAFTNYLCQSIIGAVIVGWALGFAGTLDYAQQLIVVAAIWLFQLVISPIWLRYFHFGPAEWLWRSLTYGRLQPMRRAIPG